MKYVLSALLLLAACSPKSEPYPEPKFKAGQELVVTDGFYSNASYFIPEDYRRNYCGYDRDKTVWIYTGDVYLPYSGRVQVSICETMLKPKVTE